MNAAHTTLHENGTATISENALHPTSKHARLASDLLDNPSGFHEIIEEYDRGSKAYSKLMDGLPDLSLEEFMKVQKLFVQADYDDCYRVRHWIERGLARSIKNGILNSQKKHPIDTLAEVVERLNVYDEIGVETPSVRECAETTIEALYDEDWEDALETIDLLLTDVPSDDERPGDEIASVARLLARVRASLKILDATTGKDVVRSVSEFGRTTTAEPFDIEELGVRKSKTKERQLERFLDRENPDEVNNIVKILLSGDEPTSDEWVSAGKKLAYEDTARISVFSQGVAADTENVDAFVEYLYQTGREIIEDQRHGAERPTRARLAVAEKQFKAIEMALSLVDVDWTESDEAWRESYSHVARGALLASGWIESQRENLPEPEFELAATEYAHAARALNDTMPIRGLKYQSKALRYAAMNASPKQKAEIHGCAQDFFIDYMSDTQLNVSGMEAVQSRMRYHLFRKKQALMEVSINERKYSEALSLYHGANDLTESIHIHLNMSQLENMYYTALGRNAEEDRDYETARVSYDNARNTAEMRDRKVLVDVKEHLANEDIDKALDSCAEFNGEHPVIEGAIHLIAGNEVSVLEKTFSCPALPGGVNENYGYVDYSHEETITGLGEDPITGSSTTDWKNLIVCIRDMVQLPEESRETYTSPIKNALMRL